MKLIDANYDELSGISQVIIEHKNKQYIGTAHCHSEEEYPSKFTGCMYAEMRAKIYALKDDKKEAIKEYNVLKNFVKSCTQCKNFDKTSNSAKTMFRQLNLKNKEITLLTTKITKLKGDLEALIKMRDGILKQLHKK